MVILETWEYDSLKLAWEMNHVRPCKRLYAPVGKDCPFNADEIGSQRVTEWKCKGIVSIYKDNWQVHPHQRISSKSWTGATWFFPIVAVDKDQANIHVCQANIARPDGASRRFAKKSDHFLASASLDHPDLAAAINKQLRVLIRLSRQKPGELEGRTPKS